MKTNYTSSFSWDMKMIHNYIWCWLFLSKVTQGSEWNLPEDELHFSTNEIESWWNCLCVISCIFLNKLKFTLHGIRELRGMVLKVWGYLFCPSSITSPTCPRIESSSMEDTKVYTDVAVPSQLDTKRKYILGWWNPQRVKCLPSKPYNPWGGRKPTPRVRSLDSKQAHIINIIV